MSTITWEQLERSWNVDQAAADMGIDRSLEPQLLTNKEPTKLVACRQCHRACLVHVFASAPKTSCLTCRGESGGQQAATGTLGAPIPGKTDPAKAARLADCLINQQFGRALCPFDPDHEMELKSVSHNPLYGPRQLQGYANGLPRYDQQTGETVTHQCRECMTVVSYTTTIRANLRRQNEPREAAGEAAGAPAMLALLGSRKEEES